VFVYIEIHYNQKQRCLNLEYKLIQFEVEIALGAESPFFQVMLKFRFSTFYYKDRDTMIRILLSVCFSLMFNIASAGMNSSIPQSSLFVNGTLSITVDSAPAVGLPSPRIMVMQGFISVYQRDVNWG